jgi:hypothetical protein
MYPVIVFAIILLSVKVMVLFFLILKGCTVSDISKDMSVKFAPSPFPNIIILVSLNIPPFAMIL